ncbi:MAG: hypothetical protein RL031_367 [Actinomycetota bacterium]
MENVGFSVDLSELGLPRPGFLSVKKPAAVTRRAFNGVGQFQLLTWRKAIELLGYCLAAT